MQSLPIAGVLAVALVLSGPAFAQDQADEAANEDAASELADGLSTGTPVTEDDEEAVGQPYVREVSGDWEVRCVRTAEGNDPCQLYQLLEDGEGASVAEVTVFPLPPGGQAVAGATIITPLETLLTEQVTVAVDGGGAKRYPFSFCTRSGCVSRIGLTADDLASYRAGNVANVQIVPAAAPDQKVNLSVSLTGFTAGFNALTN